MEKVGIPFRISKIEPKQFAHFDEYFDSDKDVLVGVQFSFRLDVERSTLACVGLVKYSQEEKVVALLEAELSFCIAPEGMAIIKENKCIDVENLRYVAVVATGTIRGYLAAKTEGSPINKVVLPPINLQNIIKEDFVLEDQ